MGITITSQFSEQASLPIDDRTIFSSTTTMEALAAGRRYHGLQCFVTDTSANYICDSALSWQLFSVGGGGTSATVTNLSSVGDVNVCSVKNGDIFTFSVSNSAFENRDYVLIRNGVDEILSLEQIPASGTGVLALLYQGSTSESILTSLAQDSGDLVFNDMSIIGKTVNIQGLSEVVLDAPITVNNGDLYVCGTLCATVNMQLGNLSDVAVVGVTENDLLMYNSASQWAKITLNNILNIYTCASNNDLLFYNGSTWGAQNRDNLAGATDLSSLGDISISNCKSPNDILVWKGFYWENEPVSAAIYHSSINGAAGYSHAQIDAHISDTSIHFAYSSISAGLGGSTTVILNIDGGRANEIYGPGMVVDGGSAT